MRISDWSSDVCSSDLSDLSGNENVSPNTGLAMLAWNRQATAMTSTAPPITKAGVGSQSPNTSRKPRTRCGSVIPDTVRPMPNRKPEASGGKSLRMSDMSGSNQRHDEHGGDACCHECSGRHHRTLRQAADAAHAVAAGAAATETRSETDEQPRRD